MNDHSVTHLTGRTLAELAAEQPPPCLSLYQPTHRHRPDNEQDPIRFRNLVKTLAASLHRQHPSARSRALLEPFEALAQDHEFWNHTLDGLAVLGAADCFRVFRLQRSMPELAIVADSFHTKPLRRYLQSLDRYQVLALSLDAFRVFEGNRDALDEIPPAKDEPRTIADALGEKLTEPRLTVASYGSRGGAGSAQYHGHGGKKDQVDLDAERFFRVVDRTVIEHHSRPSELPLVLAALPEHHHLFRSLSHNPMLVDAALAIDPGALSLDALRKRVWDVVEPQYRARQSAIVNAFAQAKSHGLGSDDLAQVAAAAARGRVDTLLVEAGRQIPGRLHEDDGRIERAELDDPEVDDLLDDLAALVDKLGGEVRVLPADRMPADSGVAATYRH